MWAENVHFSPSFLVLTMVIGTRKKNASVHSGAVLQNNRQPRRTREQIEEDRAREVANAIAAEAEAAAKHQAVLERIAELKALAEKDEHGIQAHTLRPDLGASFLDARDITMRFPHRKSSPRRAESTR